MRQGKRNPKVEEVEEEEVVLLQEMIQCFRKSLKMRVKINLINV
jgi:hypothetical protein